MSHSFAPDPVALRHPLPASRAASDEELIAALPDRLGPKPRSRAFRIRLVLCGCVLMALLMIYAGMIVVSSYGLWTHFASQSFKAVRFLPVDEILYELEGDSRISQHLARLTQKCRVDVCRISIGRVEDLAGRRRVAA